MSRPEPKVWMTAREIADLDLINAPSTESGVVRLAKREGWNESTLSRPRAGRGGGREYHVSLLNGDAIAEIRKIKKDILVEGKGREIAKAVDEERRVALPSVKMLNARQRRVMDARALLLSEIDRRVVTDGARASRSRAVEGLREALRSGEASEALAQAATRASERDGVPSRSQLYDWLRARDAQGIVALAPRPKKALDPLPSWFDAWLRYYARPAKPCISTALAWFKAELPDPSAAPSYSQVRYALAKLGPLERMAGREGKLAMRSRLAYKTRDTGDLLPASVYIADGKTFRAEVKHPIHGRPFVPEITSILDVHTRVWVGWSVDLSERTFATADALRVACAEWGIPAIFYTDRGPGYVSEAMAGETVGFLGRAGITHMKAWPYNAQAKGIVERFNQQFRPLAQSLPTYLGEDMDREAKQRSYTITRREMRLTGASASLPDFEAFKDMLQEARRRYNATPHEALPKIYDGHHRRHMTPLEAWQVHVADGFEAIRPDAAELDDMFRPYVIRKTSRGLVDFLTNRYFALELEEFYGEEVAVGYDLTDASKVWVRRLEETEDGRLPGALIAIAEFEGNKSRYVPLTMERDAAEKRARARRRRLDPKIEEIKAELHPARYLEQDARAPLDAPIIDIPIIDAVPPIAAPMPAADNDVSPPAPRTADGRPVFRDDAVLAAWLIANPDRVTAQDASLMRELLSRSTGKSKLRVRGIDLDALRAVVRAVA